MKKVDWDEIQKYLRPIPYYEDLIKRLSETFAYEFVHKHYNHNLRDADAYANRLLGSDPRHRYVDWLKTLQATFWQLDGLGVKNYEDLIHQVGTREKLETFYAQADLTLEQIISMLKYLLYWVLPSKIYLRELIDQQDEQVIAYITTLRDHDIRFTLDMLQHGRTLRERAALAQATHIPEVFLTDLANRADFTRMPYIRGASIRHYFACGYDSLEKLAHAGLATLTADMHRYFAETGKDASRVMELDSGIAIAGVLPKLVQQ